MVNKKCLKTRYFVIDGYRKIEGGIKGSKTKLQAEKVKRNLIKERSKKGQAKYNREFSRSKNLKVEKAIVKTNC